MLHRSDGEIPGKPPLRRATILQEHQAAGASTLERLLREHAEETAREWKVELRPGHAIDAETLLRKSAAVSQLLGQESLTTLELKLPTGTQVVAAPPYDESWAAGAGWALAKVDGKLFAFGSNGFSASGFGLYLSVEAEALVSITPQGRCQGNWANLQDSPRLRSRAGAGVVVYDGATVLVSRQPVLWDVVAPPPFTGGGQDLRFADVATPAAPGSFGPIPLAPVLVWMQPGRTYLVWFYVWHVGAGFDHPAFIGIVSADVPLVTGLAGPGPVIK